MIFNALFWTQYFQVEFVPQIEAITDTLEERVLPGFDNIKEESKQVSEKTWEAFMSMAGTGNEDPVRIPVNVNGHSGGGERRYFLTHHESRFIPWVFMISQFHEDASALIRL